MATHDRALLEAALIGYQHQVQQIEAKIEEIRAELVTGKARAVAAVESGEAEPARKKRTMTAAARKRIAAAQKKRWAEYHKNQI